VTGPATAVSVTAPTGTGSYARNSLVTVAWTASPAVGVGEFGVFAVSSAGNWYGGYLVSATGIGSYTFDFPLAVPVGTGYVIVVEYRPTAGSGAWATGASSPGTFAVN